MYFSDSSIYLLVNILLDRLGEVNPRHFCRESGMQLSQCNLRNTVRHDVEWRGMRRCHENVREYTLNEMCNSRLYIM